MVVRVWARLDQSDPDNVQTIAGDAHDTSHGWDDDSDAKCCLCSYHGKLITFDPEGAKDNEPRPGRAESQVPTCAIRAPCGECPCGKADREAEEESTIECPSCHTLVKIADCTPNEVSGCPQCPNCGYEDTDTRDDPLAREWRDAMPALEE